MTSEELKDQVADDIRDELAEADRAADAEFEEFVAEETADEEEEAPLTEEEHRAKAIAEASEATRRQEEEAVAAAELAQEELLAANVKAEKDAKKAREKAAALTAARVKAMAEGRAKKADEKYRAEAVPRPVEPEIKNLQFFPAHIAAHAMLAAIYGESHDGLHDNEYRLESDGSVRCSLKLKDGGHERVFVYVPDQVKLEVVAVVSREVIAPEDHARIAKQLKAAKTEEERHKADLAEAELLSKLNADEQKRYMEQKKTLQAA